MFNLESSIAAWRQQMLAAGIQSPVPLEELEGHLRDEVERQATAGLNQPEAFHAAVKKIGQAHLVQGEFEKVRVMNDARKWRLQQLFLVACTSLFPLYIGCMVFFKHGGFSQATSGERLSSLAAVLVFTLLMWGGRLAYGMLPVIRSKRTRDAVVCAGFGLVALWWIIYFNLIVPRYDYTAGQFGVAFLWAFLTPLGASTGLNWGIETAARKPTGTSNP
jgi:hypothetical protein